MSALGKSELLGLEVPTLLSLSVYNDEIQAPNTSRRADLSLPARTERQGATPAVVYPRVNRRRIALVTSSNLRCH